jgi:uncharacterized membrane protein YcaP (DUF421 family)
MGKRQIGQLQPFELVIALLLSELAAIPMQAPSIPLLNGIIPILVLVICQFLLSNLSLKSLKARRILTGSPNILIKNGKIDRDELAKTRLNLNDLLEMLRIANQPTLDEIAYAILETNGNLSIIPKSLYNNQPQPQTRQNHTPAQDPEPPHAQQKQKQQAAKQNKKHPQFPIALILDGEIDYTNLSIANKSESWLLNSLKQHHIDTIQEVFIVFINAQGKLIIQKKDGIKYEK